MTLPTRPDGGIDWVQFSFYEAYHDGISTVMSGVKWKIGHVWEKNYQAEHEELWRLIAAHTRERCAKIAEAPDGPDPDGNIAAAIRKMED